MWLDVVLDEHTYIGPIATDIAGKEVQWIECGYDRQMLMVLRVFEVDKEQDAYPRCYHDKANDQGDHLLSTQSYAPLIFPYFIIYYNYFY